MTTPMPMQAIFINSFGGPEVLRLEDRPSPEPGVGEVRVRMQAAPVMFFDICNRRGDFAWRDYYAHDSVFPIAPSFQGGGNRRRGRARRGQRAGR